MGSAKRELRTAGLTEDIAGLERKKARAADAIMNNVRGIDLTQINV